MIKQRVEESLFDGCVDRAVDVDIDLDEKHEVSVGKSIGEMVADYQDVLKAGTETIMNFYRNYRKFAGYLSLSGTDKASENNALSGNGLTSTMQNQINGLVAHLRKKFWRCVLDLDAEPPHG
jgi:hypothetical protein